MTPATTRHDPAAVGRRAANLAPTLSSSSTSLPPWP